MATRIGINGFGRIGRQSMKAILERHAGELEVVAINDLMDTKTNAHMLKYDSTYGRFPGEVEVTEDTLIVNGHRVLFLSTSNVRLFAGNEGTQFMTAALFNIDHA